jgi:hypothetical protein
MRINLKWFLTGKITPLEERDDLLGPGTTVLEVKGLIQLKYTYPAKNMLLILNKELLENDRTLESCGIHNAEDADAANNVLTVHVLAGAELEGNDDEEDAVNPATGSTIHEYTHDDFIRASKMLGRELPVSAARTAAVRAAPPRARPAFVDAVSKPTARPDAPASAATTEAAPEAAPAPHTGKASIQNIFKNVWYGLRREGVEKVYGFNYPGVEEFVDFWDMRLSHEGHAVPQGSMCVELFYFGEFDKVDPKKFHAMVVEKMQQQGFRLSAVGDIREAGCMYPLIAVPVICSEAEAYQLGDAVFERFGRPASERADAPPVRTAASKGPAGNKNEECVVM